MGRNRITAKEWNDRAARVGARWIELPATTRHHGQAECQKCGNIWRVTGSSIQKGHGCPKCLRIMREDCYARGTVRGAASPRDMADRLSPSEIGRMLGASAARVNCLLGDMGFQTKRSRAWVLTAAGKLYGKAVTLVLHSGELVPQNRWLPSIVDAIRKEVEL